MNIQEFIVVTDYATKKEEKYIFRPRIVCKDGFSVSLQAGEGLYSTPRKRSDTYEAVELGFPSDEEVLINEYAEMEGMATQTVYPYTPIDVIQAVIEKHGGINIIKTFVKQES